MWPLESADRPPLGALELFAFRGAFRRRREFLESGHYACIHVEIEMIGVRLQDLSLQYCRTQLPVI